MCLALGSQGWKERQVWELMHCLPLDSSFPPEAFLTTFFWVRLTWLVNFTYAPRWKLSYPYWCFRRCWKLGMLLQIHFKPEMLIFEEVWMFGHCGECALQTALYLAHPYLHVIFVLRKPQWSPFVFRGNICFLEVPQLCFPVACPDLFSCQSVHLEGRQPHLCHFKLSHPSKPSLDAASSILPWAEVTSCSFSLAPGLDCMLPYLVGHWHSPRIFEIMQIRNTMADDFPCVV